MKSRSPVVLVVGSSVVNGTRLAAVCVCTCTVRGGTRVRVTIIKSRRWRDGADLISPVWAKGESWAYTGPPLPSSCCQGANLIIFGLYWVSRCVWEQAYLIITQPNQQRCTTRPACPVNKIKEQIWCVQETETRVIFLMLE